MRMLIEGAHGPVAVEVPSELSSRERTLVIKALERYLVLTSRRPGPWSLGGRAEGLGLECKVGWFGRPERLVLVVAAGLCGVGPVMPAVLLLLVILSFSTAAQRVVHVWKSTRAAGRDS